MPCSLQSALAEFMSYAEASVCGAALDNLMLKIESYAIGPCEPCQVRKEAALSNTFCVPQGSLT